MMPVAYLTEFGWEVLVLAGCLIASGFFSGSETALFSLSRRDLLGFKNSDEWAPKATLRLTRHPRRLLNTLLLGNMLVNIAFSTTAAVLVLNMERAGRTAWVIAAGSAAPLLCLILFGEVTPKLLAYSSAKRWSVLAAGPISILQRLFQPVLWVLERFLVSPITRIIAPRPPETGDITIEELSGVMRLSASRGILDHDTGEILREIVELTYVKAGDIMVPRVDVIAYNVEKGAEGLIRVFRRTGLRKIPVYEKNLDNVLGVVHAKGLLLHPDAPLRELIRPVPFLPEAADLEKVLSQFRKTRKQMAIVVDEYGGVAGLITLEDILEEIVGDIPDLHDPESPPPVQKRGETEYIVSGDLGIRDLGEVFDIDPEPGRVSTLGGLVTLLLGRIPRAGDSVTYRNLRLTVLAMRTRRVESVLLELTGGQA